QEVARGIADLGRVRTVDVVLVGRGGGSLEDLWAFNEEVGARAIAASRVPVVSGIGHEIDFTIADLVADHRAATPTAAAAAAVPDRVRVLAAIGALRDGLAAALARRSRRAHDALADLARRLPSPQRRVDEMAVRLDELSARLGASVGRRLAWDRRELGTLTRRLSPAGAPAPRQRTPQRPHAPPRPPLL